MESKTFNLVEDISNVTSIPRNIMLKVYQKQSSIIGDYIYQATLDGCNQIKIDIGVGTLIISILNDEIKYIFKPSEELEDLIKDTLINKKSYLQEQVEQSLLKKIMETYKELW